MFLVKVIFLVKQYIFSGNLPLNVGYFFHILLIFISQLKFRVEEYKQTYNAVFLSFMYDKYSVDVKNQNSEKSNI